jgi:hypothetical protein
MTVHIEDGTILRFFSCIEVRGRKFDGLVGRISCVAADQYRQAFLADSFVDKKRSQGWVLAILAVDRRSSEIPV